MIEHIDVKVVVNKIREVQMRMDHLLSVILRNDLGGG